MFRATAVAVSKVAALKVEAIPMPEILKLPVSGVPGLVPWRVTPVLPAAQVPKVSWLAVEAPDFKHSESPGPAVGNCNE